MTPTMFVAACRAACWAIARAAHDGTPNVSTVAREHAHIIAAGMPDHGPAVPYPTDVVDTAASAIDAFTHDGTLAVASLRDAWRVLLLELHAQGVHDAGPNALHFRTWRRALESTGAPSSLLRFFHVCERDEPEHAAACERPCLTSIADAAAHAGMSEIAIGRQLRALGFVRTSANGPIVGLALRRRRSLRA